MKTQTRRFLHDCDMRRDPKILELCETFGATEGYAYWCWLLEALREQADHQLANRPAILSRITFIPENTITTFILRCKELRLIQETEDHKLTCASMIARVQPYQAKCEQNAKNRLDKKGAKIKALKLLETKKTNQQRNDNESGELANTNINTNLNTLKSTKIGTSTEIQEPTPQPEVLSKELKPVEPTRTFGEFKNVTLTKSEFEKVNERCLGRKEVFHRAVEVLGIWKKDNPGKAAKRKSDYRQLINWPIERAFKDCASIAKNSNPIASMPFIPSAAERAEIRSEMTYEKFKDPDYVGPLDKLLKQPRRITQ